LCVAALESDPGILQRSALIGIIADVVSGVKKKYVVWDGWISFLANLDPSLSGKNL